MDLNDAKRKGIDPQDLLDSSAALPAILGADLGRQTAHGLELLEKLVEDVRIGRDKDDQIRLINEFLADEGSRRDCGVAMHTQEVSVLGLLNRMSGSDFRGLGSQVKRLEQVIRSEARTVKQLQKAREASGFGGTISGLPPGSGAEGIKCPVGWMVNREGITAASGGIAAHAPVLISGRFRNRETGHVRVRVVWLEGETWRHVDVDREVISTARAITKLSQHNVPVDSNTAPLLVSFLSALQHANPGELTESVSRLGWVGDEAFMVGHDCIGGDLQLSGEEAIRELASRFSVSGTWEGWHETLKTYCLHRPLLMAAIYAALAAPLLKVLKRSGFVVDWSGDSSVGKTKALVAAASVYGSPDEENGCIYKWSAPGVTGPTALAYDLGSLPIMLDETKQGDPAVIAKMMYYLPSGQTPLRGKVDGTRQPTKRWLTVLLSTGEAPITSFSKDMGARARTILLPGTPMGEKCQKNKEDADAMHAAFNEHHGHLGRRFIDALIRGKHRWPELVARHQVIEKELCKGLTDAIQMRLMGHVAVMQLAGEILVKMKVHDQDVLDTTMRVVADKVRGEMADADPARKALDAVWGWMNQNTTKFRGQPGANQEPHEGWYGCWGKAVTQNDDEVWLEPELLDKRLKEWGYDSANVKRSWASRGWSRVDKKTGQNPKVGTNRVRMVVLSLAHLRDSGSA